MAHMAVSVMATGGISGICGTERQCAYHSRLSQELPVIYRP